MAKRKHPKRQKPVSDFRVETLEPRLLFSADAALLGVDPAPTDSTGVVVEHVAMLSNEDASSADSVAGGSADVEKAELDHELVVIDAGAPGLDALLADIAKSEKSIDVVVLQAGDDAISQLGEILQQQRNLSALHVISHGSSGALELGGQQVSTLDLLARTADISSWRSAFNDDADLLI